jgi:PAS domain S-box-containing protein
VGWIALGMAAVALVLIVGVILHSERESNGVVHHMNLIVRNLQDVLSNLADVEAAEGEYILTGQKALIGDFERSRKALTAGIDRLFELVEGNPAQRQEVERFRDLVQQDLDELQTAIASRTGAGPRAEFAATLTRRAREIAQTLRETVGGIDEDDERTLARLAQQRRVRLTAALAAVSSTLLLAGSFLLVGKVIMARSASLRKRTEEALHASENRFEVLCEQAPVGIYSTDAQGLCVYVNPRWSQMSGLSAGESLGYGWKRALHPDDRETVFIGWRTNMMQGASWEYRLLTPQGETRWIRALGRPIYSTEGEVTGYVGTLEDITEAKLAQAERHESEERLRESEQRFRNMADTAPVMIWVAGSGKGCTFFNKTWLDFTGRTMEQEIGNGWTEVVHPADLDRCLAVYSSSFDMRRDFRMEYRLRRADGEYRWLLDIGIPRFTPGNIFEGYIGSCIDITDRIRAEEERERFVSLAERSLEFISMCDTQFKPFYVNPAGRRLVGLDDLEAACQVNVQDYFFPEDEPFITNKFLPCVLRDGHGTVEIRFRHFKTGEAIWMIYNVFSIFDARGAIVGWASVSVDVTERRRAEQALQQSQQELRALAGRLINAEEAERKRISRELHDDLSQKLAMLSFDTATLILTPPASVEEMKEPLRNVQTRLVQLSQDIRRISHGLHPSILEDLGLAAALGELCEEFSARDGIEVEFEQAAVPRRLPVEIASCLYRVAQEGLYNALKHGHASQVRLRAAGSPEGIHLHICDNGVGFNAATGRSRPSLGIVSMQERLRLVQGEFSIHSHPGKGTEVRVFIPLSERGNH